MKQAPAQATLFWQPSSCSILLLPLPQVFQARCRTVRGMTGVGSLAGHPCGPARTVYCCFPDGMGMIQLSCRLPSSECSRENVRTHATKRRIAVNSRLATRLDPVLRKIHRPPYAVHDACCQTWKLGKGGGWGVHTPQESSLRDYAKPLSLH